MVHWRCREALQINPVIYDYFVLNLGIKNDLAALTIGALDCVWEMQLLALPDLVNCIIAQLDRACIVSVSVSSSRA